MTLPVVFSFSGLSILEEEARFFEKNKPYGYILFKRNIDTPEQLKKLTQSLKDISGDDTNIMIDQEGGRVQRLAPPYWSKYSCMNDCNNEEKLVQTISAISKDLKGVGINMNCAPVLDVLYSHTDTSIGDRAFSNNPEEVARLGDIACRTFIKRYYAHYQTSSWSRTRDG